MPLAATGEREDAVAVRPRCLERDVLALLEDVAHRRADVERSSRGEHLHAAIGPMVEQVGRGVGVCADL